MDPDHHWTPHVDCYTKVLDGAVDNIFVGVLLTERIHTDLSHQTDVMATPTTLRIVARSR